MKKNLKIRFYTNIPSFYQEELFIKLNNLVNLKIFYETELSEDRKNLGWINKLQDYDFNFESNLSIKELLILEKNSYHIVSGFPGGIKNFSRFILNKNKSKFIFQSEFPANINKLLKYRIGAYIFSKIIRMNNKTILLGIGDKMRNYWEALGINSEIIYPWAYFVSNYSNTQNASKSNLSPIVFAGQLIHRKGVDILLKAFKLVANEIKNELLIIGEGENKYFYQKLASDLGLDDRVRFLGSIKSNKIQEYFSEAALLILPSRYDGWGVVTNEAILNNTPVIVSSECGSKELVKHLKIGLVFESENIEDLSQKINIILSSKENWQLFVYNCKKNKHLIYPDSAIEYLLKIIEYVSNNNNSKKPLPPWFIIRQ